MYNTVIKLAVFVKWFKPQIHLNTRSCLIPNHTPPGEFCTYLHWCAKMAQGTSQASCSEPARSSANDKDDHWWIVYLHQGLHLSNTKITENLNINPKTAYPAIAHLVGRSISSPAVSSGNSILGIACV